MHQVAVAVVEEVGVAAVVVFREVALAAEVAVPGNLFVEVDFNYGNPVSQFYFVKAGLSL